MFDYEIVTYVVFWRSDLGYAERVSQIEFDTETEAFEFARKVNGDLYKVSKAVI